MSSSTRFARSAAAAVLFMPQYAEPWKHRILQSTMDAIRNYPEFPQGSRTWDERVYHPDANGVVRPLSEIWPGGRPPRVLSGLSGHRPYDGQRAILQQPSLCLERLQPGCASNWATRKPTKPANHGSVSLGGPGLDFENCGLHQNQAP